MGNASKSQYVNTLPVPDFPVKKTINGLKTRTSQPNAYADCPALLTLFKFFLLSEETFFALMLIAGNSNL